MENLVISPSKSTLGINFDVDSGILDMNGSSYPENAMEFFQPLYDWLKAYLDTKPHEIVLNLKINYLNTSSTKCVLDLMEILDNYYTDNSNIKIHWFYEEDDEDILELGQDIGDDLKLPIKLISFTE